MDAVLENTILAEAQELIAKSGFQLSPEELERLEVNDFGLGDVRKEGFVFVDILRSDQLRIVIIVLLPNQTLPQHIHPPYEGETTGKEETLRVLYGQTRVYSETQKADEEGAMIPEGKGKYYTDRNAVLLNVSEQFVIPPNTSHWFQACAEGSVNITFQKRVDETRNIFFDPDSTGCQIMGAE